MVVHQLSAEASVSRISDPNMFRECRKMLSASQLRVYVMARCITERYRLTKRNSFKKIAPLLGPLNTIALALIKSRPMLSYLSGCRSGFSAFPRCFKSRNDKSGESGSLSLVNSLSTVILCCWLFFPCMKFLQPQLESAIHFLGDRAERGFDELPQNFFVGAT